MYRKFDTVTFAGYDLRVRQGTIVEYTPNGYFIRVTEPFGYQLTIEKNEKVVGYVGMFSPYIDYYVVPGDILGLVKAEDAKAA